MKPAAFRARLLAAGLAGPFRVRSPSEPIVVDRDGHPVSMPLPTLSLTDRLWLAEKMAAYLNERARFASPLPQAAE